MAEILNKCMYVTHFYICKRVCRVIGAEACAPTHLEIKKNDENCAKESENE